MPKLTLSQKLEGVEDGTFVLIKGKVAFARLASQYSFDELDKINASRPKGKYPESRPYTTLTIQDPEVQPDYNRLNDPNTADSQATAERVISEQFYTSKSGKSAGQLHYSAINKTKNLPNYFKANPAENKYDQFVLEGEPAPGTDVLMQLRIYIIDREGNQRYGVSLDSVFFTDPNGQINYFGNAGAQVNPALESMGIILSAPPVAHPAQAPQPAVDNQVDNTGLPAGNPAPDQNRGYQPQSNQGPAVNQNMTQGYTPQSQQQAQPQQTQQQAPAPQQQFQQPQNQQTYQPQQQPLEKPQPSQSAFTDSPWPQQQTQPQQQAQPQQDNNSQSPWPQSQPGITFNNN